MPQEVRFSLHRMDKRQHLMLTETWAQSIQTLKCQRTLPKEERQTPGVNSNFQVYLDQRTKEVKRKGRRKRHRKKSRQRTMRRTGKRILKWEEEQRVLETGGPTAEEAVGSCL